MDKPKRPDQKKSMAPTPAEQWAWFDYADAMDAWLRDEVLPVLQQSVGRSLYVDDLRRDLIAALEATDA